MRDVSTPPARLLRSSVLVNLSDVDGVEEYGYTPYTVDLDRLVSVRAVMSHATGEVSDEHSIVEVRGAGSSRIATPYVEIDAAWAAYRSHADGLARIRN